MIDAQQIIVMMPLFNVNLPTNAGIFFRLVMRIASFDLLPTDAFYDKYFNMKKDDRGPINDNFKQLGFVSMYFNYNMASLLFWIVTFPVLVIVSYCLKLVRNCSNLNRQAYSRLSKSLFWGQLI